MSLTGTPEHFEDRAEALGKTFEVFAYRNAPQQFTTNFNDVTERKRTEQALREGENLRHAILDSVGIGLAYWDAEGKLILMNSIAAAHLSGVPENFIGLNIKDIFGEEAGQTYLERIERSMGSVKPIEHEDSVEVRGKMAWFLSIYTKVMGTCGDNGGVLILSHDITARKNMEESLRRSEEHYSKLLAAIPDMVIVTDMNGNIVLVNGPTLSESGYKSDEVVGHTIFSFIAPDEVKKALSNVEARIEGSMGSIEYDLIMRDGRRVAFEINADVFRDSSGRPAGLVFVGRNLTERRHLETKLRETNNKFKVMTGITRHDIKNQLMSLEGNLALVNKEQLDRSSIQSLQKAEQAARQIFTMIQFTKRYEDIGVNEPTWHDVRELVENCSKGLFLGSASVLNGVPAGTEVLADPMIGKVFTNLINNALRHGGNATTIRFYLEEHDGVRSIVCEDDGCGISPDMKNKLFTRGIGKSHGFGLYLSREILAMSGISIKEEGEQGNGAKFVMIIPQSGIRTLGRYHI